MVVVQFIFTTLALVRLAKKVFKVTGSGPPCGSKIAVPSSVDLMPASENPVILATLIMGAILKVCPGLFTVAVVRFFSDISSTVPLI